MESNKEYPFLAEKKINDKHYIVLFCKEDYGVVMLSDYENIKFGAIGNFDEETFEPLPKEFCIRINN